MSVRERLLIAGWLTAFVVGAIAFLTIQGGNADSSEPQFTSPNEVVQSGQWPVELTAEAAIQATINEVPPTLLIGTQPQEVEDARPPSQTSLSDHSIATDQRQEALVAQSGGFSSESARVTSAPAGPSPEVNVEPVITSGELQPVDVAPTPTEPEFVYLFPDGSPAPDPNLTSPEPAASFAPSYVDDDDHEGHEEHDDDDDDDHERHEEHDDDDHHERDDD
ncbi:MAG: hypothetical protein HQ478_14455 [Chloroflexi bacterium]|nr:hypothetical protein [Chloroflexota bacterium]